MTHPHDTSGAGSGTTKIPLDDAGSLFVIPWSRDGAVRIESHLKDPDGEDRWQSILLNPKQVTALKAALNNKMLGWKP